MKIGTFLVAVGLALPAVAAVAGRIYGTMIAAADAPADARAVVDMAEATMGETDRCFLCGVMLA